ncbi:MAG TPA: MltA domain-containing protein, partial [Phenylobacterium sp.]
MGAAGGWRALGGAACAALTLAACASAPPRSGPPGPVRRPTPSPFPAEPAPPRPAERLRGLAALKGWERDDHAAALAAFRETCGVSKDPDMAAVCRSARAIGPLDDENSERFFEANFRAEPLAGEGVLTAYFAPEYPARRRPDETYSAAVRPKPSDLKPVDAGMFDPAQFGRPGAARDRGDGTLEQYPDRATIEAQPPGKALAWMKPEDLFFLQVQGSGVLTFEDGERRKVLYAANNGRPFTGVANILRDKGLLAANDTSAESIRSWLAAHRGPEADAIMRLNPRYAFFSLAPDDGRPPAGAAGAPLAPGRSLAVDPGY